MALRRSVTSIPSLLKNIQAQHVSCNMLCSLNMYQNVNKVKIVGSTQVRQFFKDASRTEIPDDGRERVYYGVLTPQMRSVKWFSLTTSLIGVISQPFIYNQLMVMQSMPLVIAGCSFIGFFTFVTPFLLHYVTKKYVTHLDYKPKNDTYIASTINFFCMLKETEFKVEDVKIPEVPGMFTSIIVKGNPLFLDPRLFDDPSHYSKIMGYDKPIDFKLYETSHSDSSDNVKK